MKYVLLAILFVSARSWAIESKNAENWLYSPLMVSVGVNHICTLDSEGVRCWGDNSLGQTKVPSLKKPRQLSAGAWQTCAIDKEGLKCWGKNFEGQPDIPPLKSPIQVSVGDGHACVLDSEGVKCWGDDEKGQTQVPPLKSPTYVSVGHQHSCALDAQGVKCWGNNVFGQTEVPLYLDRASQVTAGGRWTCALGGPTHATCWGEFNDYEFARSLWPTQMSSGENMFCALYKEEVKCWPVYGHSGWWTEVPPLKSPIQVSVGYRHACAIDVEGLKCWKIYFQSEKRAPGYELDEIPISYTDLMRKAASVVTATRAEYFNANSEFAHKILEKRDLKYYYFLCLLSSPAVVSTDSDYFAKNFIPDFQKQILSLQNNFGYSKNISKFVDDEKSRGLAIISIKSALSVSLAFLGGDLQAPTQVAIRVAGAALSEPMNNQRILDLVNQVDALTLEKQKLKSSSKSAFLADTLELAANWLREKVK